MEPIGETLQIPKQTMIIAARAAGILPLGFMGTVADFADLEAFRATVRRSRKFGFAGGDLHPSEPGARSSTRSSAVRPRSSTARGAWSQPTTTRWPRASAPSTFEGKMIDVPVVERAEALIRQAERQRARRPA